MNTLRSFCKAREFHSTSHCFYTFQGEFYFKCKHGAKNWNGCSFNMGLKLNKDRKTHELFTQDDASNVFLFDNNDKN